MIRLRPTLFTVLLALAWSPAQSQPAADQPDLDIQYAERKPLAVSSVLLDVTRSGKRLVAVGERGHVVYSDDEGANWNQADTVPTRSTLTAVFGSGDRLWAAGHDAVIITSGDGGENWTRQFFAPERQQAVMDIWFSDEFNGVAMGSYGLYLVTRDGGRTWEDGVVDPENEYHLNAMVRLEGGTRLIAGEAGYSYRSLDDGATWEALTLPYEGSMWGAVTDASGCVLFFGLRGHVMRSCDAGDSWEQLPTGTESSLSGAVRSNGQVVFAGNSGTVLTWAGEQFGVHKHSSGVDFAAILPLSGGRFLLVGEDGPAFFPEAGAGGGDE